MQLSIITINYNNKEGLKKTIQSVCDQSFKEVEYIVIDGGSIDGSKEYIKEHGNKITFWLSEPDNGIYHAMNKGIKHANGDYLLFLNSGDMLINNNILTDVLPYFTDELDIISGSILTSDNRVLRTPNKLTTTFFLNNSLHHPATFISKKLFKNSCYNEQKKIVSDWEFFVDSIVKKGASYLIIDEVVSVFDTNGISNRAEYLELINNERNDYFTNYFSEILLNDLRELDSKRTHEYTIIESRVKAIKTSKFAWFCFRVLLKIFLLMKTTKANI